MQDKLEDQAQETGRLALGMGAYTAKAGKQIVKLLPGKIKVALLILLGLGIIVSTVENTVNSVFQTAINTDIDNIGELDLNTKEITKATLLDSKKEQMRVIEDSQTAAYQGILNRIKNDCKNKGWDQELTLAQLTKKQEVSYSSVYENSNSIIEKLDISDANKDQREILFLKSVSDYAISPDILAYSSKIDISKKTGCYVYDNGVSDDYIAAMPSSFGDTGSRFKVSLDNGKDFTILKGCNIPANSGKYAAKNCMFYLIGEKDAQHTDDKYNMLNLIGSGKIESIVKIQSEFEPLNSITTGLETKILATFSVSVANGQLHKEGNNYYDASGKEVKIKQSNHQIDYLKTLKEKVQSYTGPYYTLSYAVDNSGNIIEYDNKVLKRVVTRKIQDIETGELREDTVEIYEHHKYATPIIKELNLYDLASDMFGVNLDDMYVNSVTWEKSKDGKMEYKGTPISNGQAINDMAKTTSQIIYGYGGDVFHSEISGRYEWPAEGCYIVTSRFGPRVAPIAGAGSFHEAIDIGCVSGTKALAPEAGTVTSCTYSTTGGYTLKIALDDGWTAVYLHLSEFIASEGERVERGQVVALTGNTGTASTGAHLHFGLYDEEGAAVDPLELVVADKTKLRIYD